MSYDEKEFATNFVGQTIRTPFTLFAKGAANLSFGTSELCEKINSFKT